jgi:hypothetical protein
MTANESLVCSLTIFCSGQTNGRNIHRRPSRASSGLLSSSFFFFVFLLRFSSFYFSFMSRLVVVVRCVSTCWETVINITPWSLNVLFNLDFFLWKSQKERRKKVKETSESVQTLIDGHSRYRSCALSYSLRLSLLIVTSARIHNIYCIPVVEIPRPFGHCRLHWIANFSW